MSDLPAPLTPADCDLRGFEWMAIHGHRLFTSGWYLAAMKDPRGGIAALKLWWAAMLQCPAGSLPSDEEELCLLADFGQDMKAWKKHRVVAMRGFILCQDERYYHPVVAEQAIRAYESRLKASATRHADAERLRRWRASNGSHPPEKPNGQAPPETPDETRFKARFETHNETRSETRTKRVGQYRTGTSEGEKQVSNINNLLTTSPASARAVEACEDPPPGTYGDPAIQIAAQTIVEKLGRNFESSAKNPPGKPPKRSALVQAAAVLRGPLWDDEPVLLEGEILGPTVRRGPCDPQRTVVEQYAHLLSISLAEAATRLGVAA